MDAVSERMLAMEAALGYTFIDRSLLVTALTHTSFVKGDGANATHNERMEFLGDAVLELCVSEYLYHKHGEMNEGSLTKTRARLVCESALFSAACALGVPEALRLGHGEERTGGRRKPSIVSDAMEAIIGAVFLDGGIDAAKSLIISRIIERLESASVDALDRDYKTMLQEYVQHGHIGQLRYVLDTAEGPEHQKRFTMSVLLGESRIGSGAGGSKQSAGQAAAKAALDHLKQYNATKRE